MILAQPCNEPPYYFEIILVTVTVCIGLWLSHLRALPLLGWRGVMRVFTGALYDFVLFLFLFIAVSVPVAIVTPTYQCYTNRAKAGELILATASIRMEIEGRIDQRQSLESVGAGLHIKHEGRIKGGLITNDGVIVIAGDDPPAVVILQPTLIEGKVTWKCSGFPQKYMPMSCRLTDNM